MSTISALLAVLTLFAPSENAADYQSPDPASYREFDTSGTDLFWRTADRLAAGETLGDADWATFFEHPGYHVTEASGQRAPVIRHCMTAVFSPDGDVEAAKETLPDGDGRRALYGRTCDHLAEVEQRRGELERYVAGLAGKGILDDAVAAAGRYLPPAVLERVARPGAYVLLFEAQGFGRDDAIVMDALAMMNQPRSQSVEFAGHEFHHAYRDALVDLPEDRPESPLLFALDRIVNEGSASMVDKAGHVRSGSTPAGFPPEFLDLVAAAPDRLATIDEALAGLAELAEGEGAEAYEEAAEVVSRNSPWGGHLNGTYMGIAIEDTSGRERLVDVMVHPVRFFLAYQEAAASAGELFTFSEAAVRTLTRLEGSAAPTR